MQKLSAREDEKTPAWWQRQWERLDQACSDARYTELKTAKGLIKELEQVVKSCDNIRGTYQKPGINLSMATFFNRVMDNARNLHSVFKNGWHCGCSDPHRAMLQLERRAQDRESDFNALFLLPSPEAAVDGSDETALFIQQDVHISISTKVEEKSLTHPHANASGPTERESFHQSSLGGEVMQTLSAKLGSATSETHSQTPQKHGWDKFKDKAREFEKKLLKREKKDRKIETKNQTEEVPSVTGHNKAEPVGGVQHQSHLAAVGATTSTAEQSQETMVEGNLSTTREDLETETLPPVDIPSRLIPDLCQVMRQRTIAQQSLGWLLDQRRGYHNFSTAKASRNFRGLPEHKTISLKELLEGDPLRFPNRSRHRVAATLASSLLQLQRTPWLADSWNKNDVLFLVEQDKVLYKRPYLCKEFNSCEVTASSLETADGENLEDCPHFRPKMSLESLAIVLLELCVGEPLEKRPEKARLKTAGPSAQSSHEYLLSIAQGWLWEEIYDFEPMFSDIIESCMYFPNMQRAKLGKLDELRLDIYSVIVEPLCLKVDERWGGTWDEDVHI